MNFCCIKEGLDNGLDDSMKLAFHDTGSFTRRVIFELRSKARESALTGPYSW